MPVVSGSGPASRATPAPAQDPEGDLVGLVGVAFEKSMVPMVLLDRHHVVRCANPPAIALLGRTRLIGRPVDDLFCRSAAPRPDPFQLEQSAGRPDGAEAWATLVSDVGKRSVVMMRWHGVAPPGGADESAGSADRPGRMTHYLVQLLDITPTFWHFAADLPPQVSAFLLDRDLRVVHVVGRHTGSGRYDGDDLPGQLVSDLVPVPALQILQERYHAALAGQPSSFDYSSPIDAANYQVIVRPVTSGAGEILGIIAIFEDVTADRVRRNMLEQVHELSRLGSCWYSLAQGWVFGEDLLTLIGLDTAQEVMSVMDLLVVPQDRERTRAHYRQALTTGGHATVNFRLMHGRTGDIRHMSGAIEAVVDGDGTLIRAILTLADVTESVRAETAKATAAQARTVLMRHISDALTMPTEDSGQLMQSIADVLAAALGDCAVLRVLTPDGRGVETEIVSAADDTTGVAARVAACLLDPIRRAGPGIGEHPPAAGSDELWSSIDNPDWEVDFENRMGYPVHERIHHFISAPIRHEGGLLGFLRIFRFDVDSPYQAGDDDVLRILADRVGAVIAERRVRELLAEQQSRSRMIADRLRELTAEQRELLEQLAGVEERERSLLAEAIHDGPMQTIVAVMMRMENFSILGTPLDLPEVEQLVDTLEMSVQRLRTLIIALTPPDLRGGLKHALHTLAQGIFIGTETQIITSGPAHVDLSPLRKGNAHRILREALVNVRKHAQAKQVRIELAQTDTTVVARIVDNGVGAVGFDAGPGHLGMSTMRARAAAEGGRLDVDSHPGQGTTIALTLPINRPSASTGSPNDPTGETSGSGPDTSDVRVS